MTPSQEMRRAVKAKDWRWAEEIAMDRMRGARDSEEAPVRKAPDELGRHLVAQRTVRGNVSLNEKRWGHDVRRGVPCARGARGNGQVRGVCAGSCSPEQAPEGGPGRHSMETPEVRLEIVRWQLA